MERTGTNLEFGLLERRTSQVLCSRCLVDGVRSPVTQVISPHHRPRTLCPRCRASRQLHRPGTLHALHG